MSRHIADRRTPSEGGRTRAFVEVARRSGPEEGHPSIRALARRPQDRESPARLRQFLRIARQEGQA